MKLHSTPHFKRQLHKLYKKDNLLPEVLDKKIKVLLSHPKHPSLRLHKLTGNQKSYWSISIKSDIRLIFRYTKEGILFTNIGSHDEVY